VFDPAACREWAETFGEDRFQAQFRNCVDAAWDIWRRNPRSIESELTEVPAPNAAHAARAGAA